MRGMCHLSRGMLAQSLSKKTNTRVLACVTYPLLSQTIHLLQVQEAEADN